MTSYVALAPAHLTPNIGPFDTEDAVYAFCQEQTEHGKHYRPAVIGGELLPWPRPTCACGAGCTDGICTQQELGENA